MEHTVDEIKEIIESSTPDKQSTDIKSILQEWKDIDHLKKNMLN